LIFFFNFLAGAGAGYTGASGRGD